MILKRLTALFSLVVIIGFTAGILLPLPHIISNRYVHYRMFRLIAAEVTQSINEAVITAVGLCIIAIAAIAVIRLLSKRIRHTRTGNIADGQRYNKLMVVAGCALAALGCGWLIDRYFLSGATRQIWLMTQACVVFSAIFAGWLLLKRKYPRVETALQSHAIRWIAGGACIAWLLFNVVFLAVDRMDRPEGPNIVFIVVDCMRYDHLRCFGYPRNTSPTIDGLAKDGIVFHAAYANAPWTKPSVASIFTGLYPEMHSAVTMKSILPDQALTISEVLKNRGYETIFLEGGNYYFNTVFNFKQGFDFYHREEFLTASGAVLTEKLLSIFSKKPTRKYFAYIHYMDAHMPYNKSKYNNLFSEKKGLLFEAGDWGIEAQNIRKMLSKNILSQQDTNYFVAIYDGQIRLIDDNIKEIIHSLKENNLFDDTIIIVTADHGEEFLDHNNLEHGHTLYNELLHVPLIIFWPKMKHLEIGMPVNLIDLFPTLLEIAGAENHGTYAVPGQSLLKIMNGFTQDKRSPVFASATLYGDEKYCLINKKKKLIVNTFDKRNKEILVGRSNTADIELYDLSADPHEKNNIKDTEPQSAQQFINELQKLRNSFTSLQNTETVIDQKLKENLKSLGYLQ